MGLLSWAVIGMTIGWLTNQIVKIPVSQIRFERMFAGLSGALTGGVLSNALFSSGGMDIFHFYWQSAVVSILGAVIILGIYFLANRWQKVFKRY